MYRLPETRVLEVPSVEKWVLRQDEQGFSSFFAPFLPDLKIFQSSTATLVVYSTLKNHQIWQKIGKS